MNIARNMLLAGTCSVTTCHFAECNHFALNDGQHRTCVAAHLLNLNAKINYYSMVEEYDGKCRWCLMKEKTEREKNSISVLGKIFKSKKYLQLLDEEKRLNDYECLREL